jgi:N-acetylglutamate synthase-like GNAT family acetyltransferase
MEIRIRRAEPDEAPALTEIAHAAKRHWGYPETWIEHWQDDLTITPEFIARNEMYVALFNDQIIGCCALVSTGSDAELEHMWIRPDYMGNAVGKALFRHTRERAKQLNFSAMELSADPNAEGFYQRMGAERCGEVQAEIDGRPRVLPRMRVDLKREDDVRA